MQEEVENRTVNLAISTTKLTTRQLINVLQKVCRGIKAKMAQEKLAPHGKQSVKNSLVKTREQLPAKWISVVFVSLNGWRESTA